MTCVIADSSLWIEKAYSTSRKFRDSQITSIRACHSFRFCHEMGSRSELSCDIAADHLKMILRRITRRIKSMGIV